MMAAAYTAEVQALRNKFGEAALEGSGAALRGAVLSLAQKKKTQKIALAGPRRDPRSSGYHSRTGGAADSGPDAPKRRLCPGEPLHPDALRAVNPECRIPCLRGSSSVTLKEGLGFLMEEAFGGSEAAFVATELFRVVGSCLGRGRVPEGKSRCPECGTWVSQGQGLAPPLHGTSPCKAWLPCSPNSL